MKVLLAHKFFQVGGGADTFFFETARVLKDQGHEVAYLSTLSDGHEEHAFSGYFVEPPNYTSGSAFRQALGFPNMVWSKPAKRNCARLIRDFRPDVVHAFGIHTHLTPSILRAAREAGVPVVMSCNDYKHICPNYKLYHHGHLCTDCRGGRFYKAVTNRCCKESLKFSVASSIESYAHEALGVYEKDIDRFLFASHFMARLTQDFWPGRELAWSLLRNPFDASTALQHEGGDYVLFFGRLVEEKGVGHLLRAMALLPGVPLRIVGDGPLEDQLMAEARRLGLANTEFLGAKWGAELDELLAHARFTVVPSVWYENYPYVILQAYAAGKAVVGADTGGIPELLRDGEYGTIYPADDDAALAAAISARWDDAAGTAAMGRAARQYVNEEFQDERFYAALSAIYEGVLR